MKNNLTGFLGLTRKSGNLSLGGNLTEAALKRGKVKLIIIAEDASLNTVKKFRNYSISHKVECLSILTMDEMGEALGKGEIAVIGVLDDKMAKKLKELADNM